MAKQKAVVINNPQRGVALSSYFGFEEIRNLNTHDRPGIAFPNRATTKESATTVTDLISDFSYYSTDDELWAISSTKLYKRTSGGTWSSITLPGGGSSGTHRGLFIWRGYLFLLAGTKLDILLMSDETTWTKGWVDLGGNNQKRPSIVAQDDKCYFGMGQNLGSLEEVSGQTFDPTDGGTYTIKTNNSPALDLPEGFRINALEELGSKLLVCAGKGDYEANIYPWDRSSTSFDIPIKFFEDGDTRGWQIITVGLRSYLQVGKRGRWYVTDGTSAQLFAKMPDTMIDLDPRSTLVDHKAVVYYEGKIYFTIGSDGTQSGGLGVYSIDIKTGGFVLENTISTGNSTDSMEFGFLYNFGNQEFIVGWKDSSTFGVDHHDLGNSTYTSDAAYLVSSFTNIGSKRRPFTFSEVQIELAKAMTSGDSIEVQYREVQGGTWTSIKSWSTVGDQSLAVDFGRQLESVQFKIIINDEVEFLSMVAQ